MSHVTAVLVLGALAAGIASPQSFPADLQKYLNLSDPQVQSITDLNSQFMEYTGQQSKQYATLSQLAQQELQKDSPDAGAVGDDYAQMEMLRRDSQTQLGQVQSKIAAVLTGDQVMLVNGLLEVERLQPVLSEARCVSLEPAVPSTGYPLGSPGTAVIGAFGTTSFTTSYFYGSGYCQFPPMPVALSNYLKLTDLQIATIENAISARSDFANRQYLKTQEIRNEISDLTSAPTIDAAKLGAAYVAMAQVNKDNATQTDQLVKTARSVITDAQQPALRTLDKANGLSAAATEAVCQNILVLPANLNSGYGGSFLLGTVAIYDPLAGGFALPNNNFGNGCGLTVPTSAQRTDLRSSK